MLDSRLIATGLVIAVGALLVLLVIKILLERRSARRARRLNGDASESSLQLATNQATAPVTWNERMDRSFDRMIERTGLGLNSGQALGYLCLAGVWIGGLLILWRGQPLLGLLGLALGSIIVLFIFWYLQRRFRNKLRSQLPDSFYLMARSLRAGLTLEQAIRIVGDEGEEPLASEYKRCSRQIQLGMITPVALQMMADRIQLVDFNALVSAVGVHRISGGNLPLTLDRLAATSRDRNEFRGHVRSATSYARASAVFMALFGPALLLIYAIFQPPHVVAFFASPWGWLIVAGALTLEILTALWLYRLLRVEY